MRSQFSSVQFSGLLQYLRFGMIAVFLSTGLAACKDDVSALDGQSAAARAVLRGMAEGQQQLYAEKQKFATSIESLTVAEAQWVTTYRNNPDGHIYRVEVQPQAVFAEATSIQPSMKSLVAGVFVVDQQGNTKTILCEANEAGASKVAYPTDSNTCGAGSSRI